MSNCVKMESQNGSENGLLESVLLSTNLQGTSLDLNFISIEYCCYLIFLTKLISPLVKKAC